MSKRETNAERFVRVMKGNAKDHEVALGAAMFNMEHPRSASIETAQGLLDILASWRTCGSCKFWLTNNCLDGSSHSWCGKKVSNASEKWLCGYWKEGS